MIVSNTYNQADGSIIIENSYAGIDGPWRPQYGYTMKTRLYYDSVALGWVTEFLSMTYDRFTAVSKAGITYTDNNPSPGFYTMTVRGLGDYAQTTFDSLSFKVNGQFHQLNTYPVYSGVQMSISYGANFTLTGTSKKKKLISIDLQPASATIYAYPITSASHQQKYIATGIFTDGSKADITNSVKWHVADLTIASVSVLGVASPAIDFTKPGTTAITAASMSYDNPTSLPTNVVTSPSVELNVECFDYKHYRQDETPWRDWAMGYNKSIGNKRSLPLSPIDSIGQLGCALTSTCNAISGSGIFVNPGDANAALLVPMLYADYGYVGNAKLKWKSVTYLSGGKLTFELNSSILSEIDKNGFTNTNPYSITTIDIYLDQCKSVVIGIKGKYNGSKYGNHYVLVVKKNKDGSYQIYDPALLTDITKLPASELIYTHVVYKHN